MKKLEELLNLPESIKISQSDQESNQENNDAIIQQDNLFRDYEEFDKIASALPEVSGLGEMADKELDELARRATEAYDDLMDLGMNVESKYSARIFEAASSMLKNAIEAKTIKIDKKIKMIDLQIKKEKQEDDDSFRHKKLEEDELFRRHQLVEDEKYRQLKLSEELRLKEQKLIDDEKFRLAKLEEDENYRQLQLSEELRLKELKMEDDSKYRTRLLDLKEQQIMQTDKLAHLRSSQSDDTSLVGQAVLVTDRNSLLEKLKKIKDDE